MGVRDYELDSYGVINSSIFQNSFEHTRHMFLEASGVKMSDLVRLGYRPIITKAEMEHLSPLRSKDDFVVKLELASLTKVRFVF